MHIFQTIQKNLAVIGITPKQQREHQKLNSRQIIFIAITAIDITSIFFYISLETNGIAEYMDIIFSLTVVVGIIMAFISIILKKDKGFNTMERSDEELTFSEFQHLTIAFSLDSKPVQLHPWLKFKYSRKIKFNLGSENNPTSRALHEKTNRFVEKLSVIIYFVITKLGPLGDIFYLKYWKWIGRVFFLHSNEIIHCRYHVAKS